MVVMSLVFLSSLPDVTSALYSSSVCLHVKPCSLFPASALDVESIRAQYEFITFGDCLGCQLHKSRIYWIRIEQHLLHSQWLRCPQQVYMKSEGKHPVVMQRHSRKSPPSFSFIVLQDTRSTDSAENYCVTVVTCSCSQIPQTCRS